MPITLPADRPFTATRCPMTAGPNGRQRIVATAIGGRAYTRGVKAAIGAIVAMLVLGQPAFASPARTTRSHPAAGVLAQASPPPSEPSPSPASQTASPSPGAESGQGGITTGAGLVIAAILVGGLLLMRTRLLRR